MQLKVPHADKASLMAEYFATKAKEDIDLELDFSIGSIDLIDSLVGGLTRQDDPEKKEAYYNRLVDVGCYVGEVIIRNFGGTWHASTSGNGFPLGIKMTGSKTNMYLNPIGKVFKRYEEGAEHDLKTFVMTQVLLVTSFGVDAEIQ